MASRCSERRFWWTCFVAIGALALAWSVVNPIYLSADEQAHTVKAVAVAHGQLQTATVVVPGVYGLSYPLTHVEVPEAYAALEGMSACWGFVFGPEGDRLRDDEEREARCVPPTSNGATVAAATYVGTYPPTYYALAGWPSLVFSPTIAFFAMRMASGLLSAAFMASALTSAATLGGARLLGPATALGATPLVMHLSGSINPNGLEAATACAAVTSMLALLSIREAVPKRLVLRTALAVVILSTVRPLGPLLAFAVVVTTFLAAGDRSSRERLWANRAVRWAAAGVALCWAVAAGYTLLVGTAVITGPMPAGASTASLAFDHFTSFLTYQLDVVGTFGPPVFTVPEPPLVAWLWVGAVIVVTGAALVLGRWRERAALILLIAATAVLPVVAQLVSGEPITWYGRYALAVVVGLPIIGAMAVGRSVRHWGPALVIGSAILAAGIGWVHLVSMQRQAAWVISASDVLPWFGPLRPPLLLAAALAAACGYGVLLLVLALGRLRLVPETVGSDSPRG